MGSRADGILAYGYALGNHDEGDLLVRETVDYKPLKTSWWDDEVSEPDDNASFVAVMIDRLYQSIDERNRPDGLDQETAVRQVLGVWITHHGATGDGYEQWILCAAEYTGDWGKPIEIDPAELRRFDRWDEQLRHALAILELTPRQEHPAWLLTASYG